MPTAQAKPAQSLLTPNDHALILIDHQSQMAFATKSIDAVTQAVRAGLESDESTGAVVSPIHLSATYAFRGYGEKRGYDYSRSGNPTRDLLEGALAQLEGAHWESGRSFYLACVAGSWQFVSRLEYMPWLKTLYGVKT